MTAMPQMVALFNGVGGGAVFLISWAEFRHYGSTYGSHTVARRRHLGASDHAGASDYIAIFSLFAAIVGSVSFWGSNIAFGKLQEIIPGRPITLGAGQQVVNGLLLVLALAAAIDIAAGNHSEAALHRRAGARGAARERRRAADRRRRHAGRDLAAERLHRPLRRRHGLALNNPALIVAGMIVGASGTILTNLMAVAMNRSIPAIVAGGFGGGGAVEGASGAGEHAGTVRSTTAADAAIQLAYANRVVSSPATGWRSRRPSTPSAS